MAKEVSKAPYNFIELNNFVLDRCKDENELLNHDRFGFNLNTGYIDYEIETLTPLHISRGNIEEANGKENGQKNQEENTSESRLFKNPEGKYAIPGNTIRGMTRFNASVFSLSSVINKSIKKEDINNQKFYYRTYASEDKAMKKWYGKKVGLEQVRRRQFTYTVLNNVEAGYIEKKGDGYVIRPAVKIDGKSYIPVHEYDLRIKNVKFINYLYNDKECKLKREDYKDKAKLARIINKDYEPYVAETNYSIDRGKAVVDPKGPYKGYLVNSGYINVRIKENNSKDGQDLKKNDSKVPNNLKVHHYLIFKEDESMEIPVSKEQAELYTDDMKYTQKQNPNSKRANKRYRYYELPEAGEKKPVFYIKSNDSLIFGFTPYLRIPADGDIHGGIPKTHRYFSGRDFVDAIFGWQNFRTKVSFQDALCVSPKVQEVKYQMVLSQPKPSWYKGYVKQEKENELESYCTPNFKIRGRKFYWLKESADEEAMKLSFNNNNTKICTTMNCYKEGTKYEGKVCFENLSNEELGLLIYSLKQGDTGGYFNIGMGKPYGLGKCRIKIRQLVVYDIKERYMSFGGGSEKIENIDKYVSSFKNFVKEHFKDVNEIRSYKEYKLSKTIMKNDATRYMNLRMFKNKAELPDIEEVIKGKKFSDRMGGDDKRNK